MAEDADARRHEFTRRAPEMRAALIAELSALLSSCASLSEDETAVLHHLVAHAGFSLSGHLFIPALAVLWGEEESYVPAVRLPGDRVRAAVSTLRRRGVLSAAAHGESGVVVVHDALRALASGAPAALPPEPALPPRRVVVSVATSVDGYLAARSAATPSSPDFERVVIRSGDPVKRVLKLLKTPGKDLAVEGDARVLHALLKKDLVDILFVETLPVLLGKGTPLFKRGRAERKLKLIDNRVLPSGVVQSRYERG
jgi:hypothetical protein